MTLNACIGVFASIGIGATLGALIAALFIWCIKGVTAAQRSALYDNHEWTDTRSVRDYSEEWSGM